MKFTCAKCQNIHDLDELSFGIDFPIQWELINDQERSLSELGEEQCVIQSREGTSYYIRACLEIPVLKRDAPFVWGVWCSLSENSMRDMMEYWDDPIRSTRGPYFGWLCTLIPGYPDTVYLKTMVYPNSIGQRPSVILEQSLHPLALDQKNGITLERLKDIVVTALHVGG
jgi:hypothetical protein